MHTRCCAAVAVVLAMLVTPGVAAAGEGDRLYARASAAVGVVLTRDSTGTGFVVGPRQMLTAEHVVAGLDEVAVEIDGRRMSASVQRRDTSLDVALLALPEDLPTALEFRRQPPKTGEEVYAIGAARGDLSITRGVVSRVRTDDVPPHLQTDAAINPGNSGGPLLGGDGQVVGLIVSKLQDAEGIALAVPSAELEEFLAAHGPTEAAPAAPSADGPPAPSPATSRSAFWALVLPVLGVLYLLRSRPRDPVVVLGPPLSSPPDESLVNPLTTQGAPTHDRPLHHHH